MYLQKKKFEIRAGGPHESRRLQYYTGSDERSKYLFWLCRNTHLWQMTLQPKLAEIRHLEEADKRQFKEAYIYSEPELSSTLSKQTSFHKANGLVGLSLDQRVSLYSNTSSNTTSGIVSDKVFSFDESEGKFSTMSCIKTLSVLIKTWHYMYINLLQMTGVWERL